MPAQLMKSVYLFKGMSDSTLNEIAKFCEPVNFDRETTLFTQGDKADALFLIKMGSAQITQETPNGDQLEVAVLGGGSHFGEMSFIDGENRSATVMVSKGSELLKVPFRELQSYLDENPEESVKFYREMLLFLCGRLRTTTQDLSFAKHENIQFF
ncbi:MAG: cyclic nucleotide-binding domain-containing protein [Bdellovibrionales bacterium]|nr:cyclic nucleotide-binding domain-containing protein [Bdellovibrionales bacterium]